MEDDSARRGVEYAVDDDTVKMEVGIEAGTETVNEGQRAQTGGGTRPRAVRTQARLHGAQEEPQGSTLQLGITLQEVAQAPGHRQDPLAHRQRRQDVIGEMRCRRDHAPRIARWAHAAPLAGERDQEVVAALPAPRAGKAMRKDSTFQVTAELALHIGRHRRGVVVAVAALGEPGLEEAAARGLLSLERDEKSGGYAVRLTG